MVTFDTLFKKPMDGALQQWDIEVTARQSPDGVETWGVITTRYGQVGGKIQTAEDVIKKGKNIGKSNETSALQQAYLEAKSKWDKQLKNKGYAKTKEDALAGRVDALVEGGISPMLAHRYDEHGDKISFPAFAQPKLNGHRCIAIVEEDEEAGGCKVTLWSRTRKPITGLPHINKDIKEMMDRAGIKSFILDGELYNHDYKDRFEELSSFIRNPTPKPGCEVVQYHVYDQSADIDQEARLRDLVKIFGGTALELGSSVVDPFRYRWNSVVLVETVRVNDEDEMMATFEHFLSEGFEGLMVRQIHGKYVGKRSYELQKVKEFVDAEFKVVGVTEGRGKLAGHAIFECITEAREYPSAGKSVQVPGNDKFTVKMKGDTANLKRYWENPVLALGRLLTIKYQYISNKKHVPIFPVALNFRDE